MKISIAITLLALLAVTVTSHQDADVIVPESDIVEAPAATPKRSVALAQAVKRAKKVAPMDDALEAFKTHMTTRIAKLHERKKLAVAARKASVAQRKKAQWATARIMASNKALIKDMKNQFPVLIKADATTKNQDQGYGKCITPPEIPSVEQGSEWFNYDDKKKKKHSSEMVDSVGAIRTMCADEIKSKGSYREHNEKVLVKTQKTEANAKEQSNKAENAGSELRTKAEDQEKSHKEAAESSNKASKETASKTKYSQESSTKNHKEATEKQEATEKVASQESAAKYEKGRAAEKKEKIDDAMEAHYKAKKDCETAEEKKTVVVKSTDTTIEVKGKHEWQHQELTDKAGVEHSHKEMQRKMDEIIKNAAPHTPIITVRPGLEKSMKAQRTTMEASQKQQQTSMKEYMHKESQQKSKETKDKMYANELVLKSNENSMKKATHNSKPITNVVVYGQNRTEHPTKEIASKLVKENHALWGALMKKKDQKDTTGEVDVLKHEVKELTWKMSITRSPTPGPAPTPSPTLSHKENKSKHPFASLEKNVKAIMDLKESVEKSKASCAKKTKHAEKTAKGDVESEVKKNTQEAMWKKGEEEWKLERAQKVLVAAKMTAKEKEHEICDKSRISSEASNKHQTGFWLGLVKELKVKSHKKPENTSRDEWKNKLCAAVHEDIGMVSGIDRAALLE